MKLSDGVFKHEQCIMKHICNSKTRALRAWGTGEAATHKRFGGVIVERRPPPRHGNTRTSGEGTMELDKRNGNALGTMSRRTVLKAGAGLAAGAVLGFPVIVRAQSESIKIGHLTPMTGFLGV